MALIQQVFQLHRYGDDFVFGKKGNHQMLWRNKNDLQEFKKTTIGSDDFEKSIIVMGSNTFKSFPSKLPDRLNYVLSTKESKIKAQNGDEPDMAIQSIDDFKELMLNLPENSLVSIIGGFGLIKELLDNQFHFHEHEHHDHSEKCVDCNHSRAQNDYEIQDLYITIFESDFNTTGDLITVSPAELQELVKDYQLLEIKNIDQNVNLYHYVKRDL